MPRKKVTKKTTKKKKAPQKRKFTEITSFGKLVGIVTHYFPKVSAAAVKLKTSLALGDIIRIKGHTTDFIQPVESLQINRIPIKKGKKGQEIGLLVKSRVRRNDKVYKIEKSQSSSV